MVKKVGKYEVGKTLGEGSFGKVKVALDTETGQQVAIKILDKEKIQQQNMGAQIKKEISIMKMIAHPHVVKLFEVLASKSKIFIVLELVTGGELFDGIVKAGRFDETTTRKYFRQLLDGIRHCHDAGVAHRDLKPENLLLDADGNLKITDFGLSALYTSAPGDESRATLLHTTCGTPNYVAPEVLVDKGYDGRAADIWSCGVILYVMLAGFLPFDEPHMSALFRKIQKAEFTYPAWFTAGARNLIDSILKPDPAQRAKLEDIQRNAWLYEDVADKTVSLASVATASSASLSVTVPPAGGDAGFGGFMVPIPSLRGAMAKHAPTPYMDPETVDAEEDAFAFDSPGAMSSMATMNVFGLLMELQSASLRRMVRRAAAADAQGGVVMHAEVSITGVIAAAKATVARFSGLELNVAVVEAGVARLRIAHTSGATMLTVWTWVDSPSAGGTTVRIVNAEGSPLSADVARTMAQLVQG